MKGAAEMMLARATHAVSNIYGGRLGPEVMGPDAREEISARIDAYAHKSLRTIGILSKDFAQWPPANTKRLEEDPSMVDFDDVSRDMTWVGICGSRLCPWITIRFLAVTYSCASPKNFGLNGLAYNSTSSYSVFSYLLQH